MNLANTPATESDEYQRLIGMGYRLYRFMTLLAIPALGLGIWLWLGYRIGQGAASYWLMAKLLIVAMLLVYHGFCRVLLTSFAQGRNRYSHVWYRWFNEVPVILLVTAVLLVVVKPF